MTTLIIPLDRLEDVRPGDRLVAIDDVPVSAEKVFTSGPQRTRMGGPVGIPFRTDSPVEGYLYPDSLVERSITVERKAASLDIESKPAPKLIPPQVFLHERERKALRRTRHYEETLRLLSDPDGNPVDLRVVVPIVNRYDNPRSHSHTAGILATWYGWTEQTASYTWRLTPAGRRVLAAIDAGWTKDRRRR